MTRNSDSKQAAAKRIQRRNGSEITQPPAGDAPPNLPSVTAGHSIPPSGDDYPSDHPAGHPSGPPSVSSGPPVAIAAPPVANPFATLTTPTTQQQPVPIADEADSDTPDRPQTISQQIREWYGDGPAWLTSTFVHLLVLLVTALLVFPNQGAKQLELILSNTERVGEQMLDDSIDMSGDDTVEEDPVESEPDEPVEEVTDVPPPKIDTPKEIPINLTQDVVLPQVGAALDGRSEVSKKALLAAYGGTPTTEATVQLALKWIVRQQRRQGQWSLKGPYSDGSFDENEIASTAMAMLALQGAGHTHKSGDFKRHVGRGRVWLVNSQNDQGAFWNEDEGVANHRLYTHAMSMMAICELYAMTRDPQLKKPAQAAIDYACKIQDVDGGWRYEPAYGSDTSVTGWFVMGLQSGRMAGLDVPSTTMMNVHKFLDQVAEDGGAQYAYMPRHPATMSMTAEALLCRQYLGWSRDDDRLRRGVAVILENPISSQELNAYYWYYATQVLHHMEGDAWDEWNAIMRDELPSRQIKRGREAGSWNPQGHSYGTHGGRLFITCLCTYMMEVYYRHLPLYSKVY